MSWPTVQNADSGLDGEGLSMGHASGCRAGSASPPARRRWMVGGWPWALPVAAVWPSARRCLRALWIGAGAACIVLLASCAGQEQPISVDLHDTVELPVPSSDRAARDHVLRFGISSMISPGETRNLYTELAGYLGHQLGRRVVLKQRRTYEELNDLLALGEVDLAFVCSGAYVEAHDQFGTRLLAVPVVGDKAVYRSYIIARPGSGVHSLASLRGKRFAFVDPLSHTGYLVPTYLLARDGESPDSFFSSYVFTNSHDNSIRAVADALVDAAAVDSLVYDFVSARDRALARKTEVIEKSEAFAMPPLVVPYSVTPALEAALRSTLLSMHEDERGRSILQELSIDRFVTAADDQYDSIRKMRAFVASHAAGGAAH